MLVYAYCLGRKTIQKEALITEIRVNKELEFPAGYLNFGLYAATKFYFIIYKEMNRIVS